MKSNSSMYFKYAIGEIILVMIGILLALQVNNWNNIRLKNKLEKTVLLQLREDIGNMLNDVTGDYETLKMGLNSHLNIEDYIEKDVTYHDSMCFQFHWLIKDEYIYPITSAYDVIQEEGLDLIKNDTIRYLLQNAYEYVLPRISKESPFYPDLEGFFGKFIQQNFTTNTDSTLIYKYSLFGENFKSPYLDSFDGKTVTIYAGYVPNDFEALKKNSEFKVLLRQAFRYRVYKVNRYELAIDRLTELDEHIKKELNITND